MSSHSRIVIATTPFWQAHLGLAAGLTAGLILLPLYVSTLIRKLSEAKREAEEANRAKGAFLASISHEFRTPLNAIIGLSDLIGNTRLDSEQQEMSETIGKSGRQLLALINSILDFSRAEAGRISIRAADFDLVSTLGEIRSILALEAQRKGVQLAIHCTARTPQLLVGDKHHLEEVLTNLAGNAVKFTDHGYVAIAVDSVSRDGDNVRLRFEITDTGIGISPEAQTRIFDRFTQADETIIDRFGGTGLGLAIAKQLVELQGGTIGVESIPGQGSTFWFELDLKTQPQDMPESVTPPTPVVVVAVDDNARALISSLCPLQRSPPHWMRPRLRWNRCESMACGVRLQSSPQGSRRGKRADIPPDRRGKSRLRPGPHSRYRRAHRRIAGQRSAQPFRHGSRRTV